MSGPIVYTSNSQSTAFLKPSFSTIFLVSFILFITPRESIDFLNTVLKPDFDNIEEEEELISL